MLENESFVFKKPYPSRQDWETAVERINEIANEYINKKEKITFDDSMMRIHEYFSMKMDGVSVGLYGLYKDYPIHEIITQYGVGVRYEETVRLSDLIEKQLNNYAKYATHRHLHKTNDDENDKTNACKHCTNDNSCFFHYLCNSLYIYTKPQIVINVMRNEEIYGPQPRVFGDIYSYLKRKTGTEDDTLHGVFINKLLIATDTDHDLLELGIKLRIKSTEKIKEKLKEYSVKALEITFSDIFESVFQPESEPAADDAISAVADDIESSSEDIYEIDENTFSDKKSVKETTLREFFNKLGKNDDGRFALATLVVTEELILAGMDKLKIRNCAALFYEKHKRNPKTVYTVVSFNEIKDLLQDNTSVNLSGIVQSKCPHCKNESIDCLQECVARCDVECSAVELACEVTERYYRDIACWVFSLHRQPSLEALQQYAGECGYNVVSRLDYGMIKRLRGKFPKVESILES